MNLTEITNDIKLTVNIEQFLSNVSLLVSATPLSDVIEADTLKPGTWKAKADTNIDGIDTLLQAINEQSQKISAQILKKIDDVTPKIENAQDYTDIDEALKVKILGADVSLLDYKNSNLPTDTKKQLDKLIEIARKKKVNLFLTKSLEQVNASLNVDEFLSGANCVFDAKTINLSSYIEADTSNPGTWKAKDGRNIDGIDKLLEAMNERSKEISDALVQQLPSAIENLSKARSVSEVNDVIKIVLKTATRINGRKVSLLNYQGSNISEDASSKINTLIDTLDVPIIYCLDEATRKQLGGKTNLNNILEASSITIADKTIPLSKYIEFNSQALTWKLTSKGENISDQDSKRKLSDLIELIQRESEERIAAIVETIDKIDITQNYTLPLVKLTNIVSLSLSDYMKHNTNAFEANGTIHQNIADAIARLNAKSKTIEDKILDAIAKIEEGEDISKVTSIEFDGGTLSLTNYTQMHLLSANVKQRLRNLIKTQNQQKDIMQLIKVSLERLTAGATVAEILSKPVESAGRISLSNYISFDNSACTVIESMKGTLHPETICELERCAIAINTQSAALSATPTQIETDTNSRGTTTPDLEPVITQNAKKPQETPLHEAPKKCLPEAPKAEGVVSVVNVESISPDHPNLKSFFDSVDVKNPTLDQKKAVISIYNILKNYHESKGDNKSDTIDKITGQLQTIFGDNKKDNEKTANNIIDLTVKETNLTKFLNLLADIIKFVFCNLIEPMKISKAFTKHVASTLTDSTQRNP